MQRIARCLLTLGIAAVAGCAEEGGIAEGADAVATAGAQDAPVELVGTYRLVRRELPDGSVLEPPAIVGFMTFTAGHRNFHLYQPGAGGTPSSVSMVATYSAAGEEYTESTLYEVASNVSEGSGLDYNIPGSTFTTPISRSVQNIQFRDTETGPMLTFSRDSMVAALDGAFVDRWVRVE